MSKQEFSPLRSRASRKPWPECPDVVLFRCRRCGGLFQALNETAAGAAQNGGSTEGIFAPVCCAAGMERLISRSIAETPDGPDVEYAIVGGFNNSAVRVFWQERGPQDRPEWILLKTFTGGSLKYLTARKEPPVVFPLADEDAYVYCDRAECERCVFRCKKGFVIYIYFRAHGLFELSLDKISEYFKNRS